MHRSERRTADAGRALGTYVRETRASLGLTQREAARKAGVSKTTWQLVETGGGVRSRATTLHAIASALHVAPQVLLRLREGETGLAPSVAPARSREELVDAILRGCEWLQLDDLTAIEDAVQVRAELRRRQRREGIAAR